MSYSYKRVSIGIMTFAMLYAYCEEHKPKLNRCDVVEEALRGYFKAKGYNPLNESGKPLYNQY